MDANLNLGEWIIQRYGKKSGKSKFATKIGADRTLLSRWLSGKGISEEYQAKIRKAGYIGPWPEEVAEAVGTPLTRDDFLKSIGALETRLKDLEQALEDLAEGLRAAIPSMPKRSRPGVPPQ